MKKLRRLFSGNRLRRLLMLIMLVPLVGFGLLNLLFATPWGTGILERKVEARVGLPCSIHRISWVPWSGLTLKEIRLMSPDDADSGGSSLRIESVKVDPSWMSLVKGRRRFERLEIRGVTGEISLEFLKSLLSEVGDPVPSPAPPGPVPQPPPGDPVPVEVPEPPSAQTPGPMPASPVTGSKAETEPVAVAPVDHFVGVLSFEDISLDLFSRQFPNFSAAVTGLKGEFPVWGGGEGAGSVTVGNFEIGHRYDSGLIEIPVVFKDRYLRVNDYQLKLFGLNTKFTAAMRLVPGLPYGIQVDNPPQQMDLSPIFPDRRPPFTIGALQSSSQLSGYAMIPSSVRGESLMSFQNLVILDQKDGSETIFHSGSARFDLSAAGLLARDFRILGDEEAVLGNGFVTARGDLAGVVRIVANPSRADSHEQRVAKASRDWSFEFRPLVTPDREYRDLHFELREGGFMVDLGKDSGWIPFFPAARAILGARESQATIFP